MPRFILKWVCAIGVGDIFCSSDEVGRICLRLFYFQSDVINPNRIEIDLCRRRKVIFGFFHTKKNRNVQCAPEWKSPDKISSYTRVDSWRICTGNTFSRSVGVTSKINIHNVPFIGSMYKPSKAHIDLG